MTKLESICQNQPMKRQDCPDPFLRSYVDAALWTTDNDCPGGVDYVECGRADELWPTIHEAWLEKAQADCAKFETENATLLARAGTVDQNGHDFWLSRNGHGAGFFDRGYPDEVGDGLQEAARNRSGI